jgi:acetyl esterase/lipase
MKRMQKTLIAVLVTLPLLAMLSACSPLGILNGLSSSAESQVTANLAYGAGLRQKLDVYAPRASNGSAPVVLFFYGGNWNTGNRADYAFVGHALASRGILAVVADYRLYPEVRYPEFVQDSAAAAAWTLREVAQYGGDPKRVFVMGHSAGAYNAAMVALDGKWLGEKGLSTAALRGLIGLAGPYDFIPIENMTARPIFFYPDTPPASQPINHVTAGAPPALLIAAEKDTLVNPVRNTGGLARRLRENGVPVSEIYFDKVSHASLVGTLSVPLRMLAPTLDKIETFVKSDGGRAPAMVENK